MASTGEGIKIALVGYGKMGKAIEACAMQKGHQILLRISSQNLAELTVGNLQQCDVAIECSNPHSAPDNIKTCIRAGIPVICGSTGWLDQLETIRQFALSSNGGFLYASNFSIGVNIFFELNRKLAALMAPHTEYKVSIEEIHHTGKKDAPSGTAISIAEGILNNNQHLSQWVNHATETTGELPIISKRIDPAPGTHSVNYRSAVDDIEITHTAHNRDGFAAGAVLAAEFMKGKKGLFTMKDVLGI